MADEKNKCSGGLVIVMVVWSDIFLHISLYRCLCLHLRVLIYTTSLTMLGCDISSSLTLHITCKCLSYTCTV